MLNESPDEMLDIKNTVTEMKRSLIGTSAYMTQPRKESVSQ